jgi:hypothetical protein
VYLLAAQVAPYSKEGRQVPYESVAASWFN